MEAVIAKARVLVEALPFISEFRGKTVVVKIGGAALEDPALRQRFAEDLILLDWVGIHVVVVHGGGKQITALADRLGHKAEFVESFAPNGSVSTVARVGRDVFGRPPNKTKPRRRSTTASTARKNRKRVRASFKTQMTALRAMSKTMTLAELRKLLRTSDFPEVHRIVRAELKRRGGGRASAKKSRRAPARRNKPSGERSYSFPSRWMPKMSLRSDGAIEMLGEHYSSIDDALRVHNRIHGIRMKYDPVRHSFYLESR